MNVICVALVEYSVSLLVNVTALKCFIVSFCSDFSKLFLTLRIITAVKQKLSLLV
jgi:hypothetical protein